MSKRNSKRKKPSKPRKARRVPANKGKRYPAEVLTPDEVRRLLRIPSTRAPTGIRNRALITVLYRSGLRCAEALALQPKDIDRKAGSLRVLHGKGDKSRTVGMDPEAFAVLERWLDVRAARGINGRAAVFCTLHGQPLAAAYVRVLLPRLGRKAGIEKRVHPHGLRHTLAAELRAEGKDIGVISKQLGHESIATTARYLDHVAPAAVIEAMRERKWNPDGHE
jgi:site-specific recombinase XerD